MIPWLIGAAGALLALGVGVALLRRRRRGGGAGLHDAARTGDVQRLRDLLDGGAGVDDFDPASGAMPLHLAVDAGHLPSVELLIARGAGLEARAAVARLDDGQAAPGPVNSPLLIAAAARRYDLLEMLLAAGADANAADVSGVTPLFMAAQAGDAETVRRLLTAPVPARADARTDSGATPLHTAAERGHTEVVRLLLAHGARPDAATDVAGETPLHAAALHGHEEIVRILLEQGAEVNLRERRRNTALHLAAYGGFTRMVELLLERGAAPDLSNGAGHTAVAIACNGPGADVRQREPIRALLEARVGNPPEGAAQPPEWLLRRAAPPAAEPEPIEPEPASVQAPSPAHEVDALLDELEAIGDAGCFLYGEAERTRDIGERLFLIGGAALLVQARQAISVRLLSARDRELEVAWDGVGEGA